MILDLPPDLPKPAIIRPATPDIIMPRRQALTKTRRRAGGEAVMLVTPLGTFSGVRSSNTITFSGLPDTSAYPEVLALTSWRRDGDGERSLSAITFGGNAGTIMTQGSNTSRQAAGGAVSRYAGAWSGDIVETLSGSTNSDHQLVLVGLSKAITNVLTQAAAQDSASTINVTPADPGAAGARIAYIVSNSSGATATWANAIEMSDGSSGNHMQTSSYDLGADATDMVATISISINAAKMSISIN